MKTQKPLSQKDQLIKNSERVYHGDNLIDIKSIFPFTLFPDRIIVDGRKINIVRMIFFGSYYSSTIPIENIQEVIVESDPFFASLIISEKWDPGKRFRIRFLKKNEAYDAKSIIQELMIQQQNVQTTSNTVNI